MLQSVSWCDFCIAYEKYQNMGMTPEYMKFSEDVPLNRELFVTENFRVIVALGPLVTGNLLIITNDHVTSMAQLDKKQINELVVIKNRIHEVFSELDLRTSFFEHGIKNESDSNGCISHAHLQVLPIQNNLLETIQSEYKGYELDDYRLIINQSFQKNGYLYYETSQNEKWIFPVDKIESQYIRKLTASELGIPAEWNWREYPKLDLIKKTVEMLFNKFK